MGTDESAPAPPIRVLLVNLGGVVEEIIRATCRDDADIELVDAVNSPLEALLGAGNAVDVVLLGVEALVPPPGLVSHLLTEYPGLRILAVTPGGEQTVFFWLGLRRRRLRGLAPEYLSTMLRYAVRVNPTE
jgi:hypothetical protein